MHECGAALGADGLAVLVAPGVTLMFPESHMRLLSRSWFCFAAAGRRTSPARCWCCCIERGSQLGTHSLAMLMMRVENSLG